MKKMLKSLTLTLLLSLTITTVAFGATGPAYPEVPVTERTSNLAENQNFVDIGNLRSVDNAIGKNVKYDMYGNPLRNARLAGGGMTNEDGIFIWNGKLVDGIEMIGSDIPTSYSEYGWRQDSNKPIFENGVSNWYYGNQGLPCSLTTWEWMSDQDNIFSTKKAYCFNEYGYLYVNTITPDGFIVNERGQMITEDGTLVEHEVDALTHDAGHGAYIGAPIGFMRQEYFTVCIWAECGGKCFTGANEKEFSDRPSQYTEEENRRKISEVRDAQ